MSSTSQTGPTDEQPAHDRPFAAVAALWQAWQAAERAAAAPAPAPTPAPYPPPASERKEYMRGVMAGATIGVEEVEELTETNRQLRAHLRVIAFEFYCLRHDLMTPNLPRRGMIERCQALAARVVALVNQPREHWPWVDTRGIDGPAPFAAEREGEYAPPWREVHDKATAAFDALRALTTPEGPRTPGYQERKRQMEAIRDAAYKLARAEHEYGRQRGKHGA
jgi:hypothetical protein